MKLVFTETSWSDYLPNAVERAGWMSCPAAHLAVGILNLEIEAHS